MALNPYNVEEYRTMKLNDLIDDAVERKDRKALEWLKTESAKKVERTKGDKVMKVAMPLPQIRANYAKKFLNYSNKSKASAEAQRKRKAEKREQERLALFDDAFARIEE